MFMNGIRQHWENPLYAANLFAGIVCLITTNVTHPTISILSESRKIYKYSEHKPILKFGVCNRQS